MNCQSFEKVINDLARDLIMDAAQREAGLNHAVECERCAARLADERALGAGLRALAASAKLEQAPPRVEAALVAAFRERKTTPAIDAAPVRSRRWQGWAVGAVAAALALFLLVAGRLQQSASPERRLDDQNTQAAGVKPNKPDDGDEGRASIDRGLTRRESNETAIAGAGEGLRTPPRSSSIAYDRTARRDARRPKGAATRNLISDGGAAEVATDFIPLVAGAALSSFSGGHVVRVELPRSALASFGLPVNMERADERVKADVLVGNDGLARAVRLVR